MTPAGKVLRAARKTSRRQDYSSSTKRALLDNATDLFTDHGYAGTSLDEVVAAARVTKGALYHHYSSKLALFESVFMRCQEDTQKQIEKSLRQSKDPWERAQIGLRTFLDICQQPTYRRICIQEGPVALGHARWQEVEKDFSFGLVYSIVDDLLKSMGGADDLVETFAHLFYGAMQSAGDFVADSENAEDASDKVHAAITAILAGLRLLPDIGATSQDGADEATG
ncbi:MAG: TetR/AcrR family transcriptional regulator [Aeromicrobium sp.]